MIEIDRLTSLPGKNNVYSLLVEIGLKNIWALTILAIYKCIRHITFKLTISFNLFVRFDVKTTEPKRKTQVIPEVKKHSKYFANVLK